jgi:hypothetical protein
MLCGPGGGAATGVVQDAHGFRRGRKIILAGSDDLR